MIQDPGLCLTMMLRMLNVPPRDEDIRRTGDVVRLVWVPNHPTSVPSIPVVPPHVTLLRFRVNFYPKPEVRQLP